MSKEAMKLAIAALKGCPTEIGTKQFEIEAEAIVALSQALVAPVQPGRNHYEDGDVFERIAAMKPQPAQQESESNKAAYQRGYLDGMAKPCIECADRQWVGLTHDEYDAICDKHSSMSDFDFLEDIEAKLKDKNQ